MDKVYVVVGESGSYSYYGHWVVAVFSDESTAEEYARKCQQWCDDNAPNYNWKEWANPLDENMYWCPHDPPRYKVEKHSFKS